MVREKMVWLFRAAACDWAGERIDGVPQGAMDYVTLLRSVLWPDLGDGRKPPFKPTGDPWSTVLTNGVVQQIGVVRLHLHLVR
ncbi:hypothetical protein DUNSADRAFT_14251 [Dunaliella salina]|uniref:Encoded protein n=1 Tax=Dunaliella salina TaxID=3046 RepID=A0ABQ7G7P6_DUNSA|nr:hypothetical protein DUNSADRAFT_14251 [Dunaliella salina]|eukprot:KAF5830627.1 hypothetical protein DUNSADRAFT_14251 [Dunaliella salina]